MYVVSLKGKDVFQGNTIVCTITQLSNLNKVCNYIKKQYGIEFENIAAYFSLDLLIYDNITDDRDISLVIELVYTEDDIDALLF